MLRTLFYSFSEARCRPGAPDGLHSGPGVPPDSREHGTRPRQVHDDASGTSNTPHFLSSRPKHGGATVPVCVPTAETGNRPRTGKGLACPRPSRTQWQGLPTRAWPWGFAPASPPSGVPFPAMQILYLPSKCTESKLLAISPYIQTSKYKRNSRLQMGPCWVSSHPDPSSGGLPQLCSPSCLACISTSYAPFGDPFAQTGYCRNSAASTARPRGQLKCPHLPDGLAGELHRGRNLRAGGPGTGALKAGGLLSWAQCQAEKQDREWKGPRAPAAVAPLPALGSRPHPLPGPWGSP